MNDENIIRDEAAKFVARKISLGSHIEPITQFVEIKNRLYDFYSSESKAIFLDEIEKIILLQLQNHREKKHDGKSMEGCGYEEQAEKILFYLRQELSTLPAVAHQKKPSNPQQIRNKVFVSYSHEDKHLLLEIKKHFKPFLNKIDFWDDSRIEPGQIWKEEIRNAISETKVAILLLSANFLASDFISNNELPPLLKAAEEEGAVILIVITKPCLFEEFPELNQYQAMNHPSKPVIKLNEVEQQELFVNLVRQTKRILEKE
ncbi:MAG: hypothetical protein RL204_1265 [Bacteroidota bacterium]|jgi:hypothetical protein